ncbi:MAG: hypothetical protein Q9217_005818 [Psora testacea]
MLYSFCILALAATLASSAVVPRQAANSQYQAFPPTAPPDGSFSNGKSKFVGLPPESEPNGDSKGRNSNEGGSDSATQSACGIPDNAYLDTKVAIHPYFLKYADLSRYCMQDVCISFWDEKWSKDMMLKVTDICSTDPNDPTHCATPNDIKIGRTKAKIWSGQDMSALQGNSYPEKSVWFFMKCWADGMVQPAYTDNWFAQPPYVNNLEWAQAAATEQHKKNQEAYKVKGWPTYENGAYSKGEAAPISDWTPGQEPGYTPIAGGKGFGSGGGSGSSPAPYNNPISGAPSASPLSVPPANALSTTPATGNGSSAPYPSSVSGSGQAQGSDQGQGQVGEQKGVQGTILPKPTSNLQLPQVEQKQPNFKVNPNSSPTNAASGDVTDDGDECDAEL